MQYYELDEEEQAALDSYEKGEWERAPNKEETIEKFQAAARNTLNRNKSINIRISERDLLKARAAHEGIPYQTLITSVLHKFTNQA